MKPEFLGFVVVLTGGMMLSSCDKRPDYVLSDDEMVSLMADMQLAESYSEIVSRGGDYSRERSALADGVLAAHGVSRENLDSTLNWYGKNLDLYNELFKKVDKEIDSRRKRLMKESGVPEEITMESLWPYSSHIILSRLGSTDNISFSIPADNLSKGDRLVWKLNLNNSSDMIGMLGVDYSDGSSGMVNRNVMGSSKVELNLQTDTARTPTRVFGVIRTRQANFTPIWADSISLTAEPFDSTRYYSSHSVANVRPLRQRPAKIVENQDTTSDHKERTQPIFIPKNE